ncbi:unnamed protein product, partial [Cyprideis torosa]
MPNSGTAPDQCSVDNQVEPIPGDCKAFHRCRDGDWIRQPCSQGLLFDSAIYTCNFENLVNCIDTSAASHVQQ